MASEPRTGARRKADVLEKLLAREADVWVATASEGGEPYLVPLSFAWQEDRVVLATERASRTVRNLEGSGRARLAFGATRDVVMADAVVEQLVPLAAAGAGIADAYAAQAGWDPRRETGVFMLALLRLERVQAWREADELRGRTLMLRGTWLV